jgi:hypothetical protein
MRSISTDHWVAGLTTLGSSNYYDHRRYCWEVLEQEYLNLQKEFSEVPNESYRYEIA